VSDSIVHLRPHAHMQTPCSKGCYTFAGPVYITSRDLHRLLEGVEYLAHLAGPCRLDHHCLVPVKVSHILLGLSLGDLLAPRGGAKLSIQAYTSAVSEGSPWQRLIYVGVSGAPRRTQSWSEHLSPHCSYHCLLGETCHCLMELYNEQHRHIRFSSALLSEWRPGQTTWTKLCHHVES
jgi:hypothetical protein